LESWSAGKPVRSLTVTAQNLIKGEDACEQIGVFDDGADEIKRQKSKKREEILDKIRQRYGKNSIISASVMDSDIGIYEKSNSENNEE
jgi:hypothetical protein